VPKIKSTICEWVYNLITFIIYVFGFRCLKFEFALFHLQHCCWQLSRFCTWTSFPLQAFSIFLNFPSRTLAHTHKHTHTHARTQTGRKVAKSTDNSFAWIQLRMYALYLSPRPTFEATQQQLLQMSKRQLVAAAFRLCRRRSISFFPSFSESFSSHHGKLLIGLLDVRMCVRVFWPGREHKRESIVDGIAVLYLVN